MGCLTSPSVEISGLGVKPNPCTNVVFSQHQNSWNIFNIGIPFSMSLVEYLRFRKHDIVKISHESTLREFHNHIKSYIFPKTNKYLPFFPLSNLSCRFDLEL